MKDFVINLIVADYLIGGAVVLLILIVGAVVWFRESISDWRFCRRISSGRLPADVACTFCEDQQDGCPVCNPFQKRQER